MINDLFKKILFKIKFLLLKSFGLTNLGSHLIYSEILSENSLVIDVGGNVGEFSTLITQKFKCKCYYIEPDKKLFQSVKFINNVSKFNFAISSEDGNRMFYYSKNSEANSFNKEIPSKYGIINSELVDCIKLDTFLNNNNINEVDILKLDVEGAEIEILDSLSTNDLEKIIQITVEFHDFYDSSLEIATINTINQLQLKNFSCIVYSSGSYENVLFINNTKINFSLKQRICLKLIKFL